MNPDYERVTITDAEALRAIEQERKDRKLDCQPGSMATRMILEYAGLKRQLELAMRQIQTPGRTAA